MSSRKKTTETTKVSSNIKKTYKQPPCLPPPKITQPAASTDVLGVLGVEMDMLSDVQKKALDKFMDVYNNVDKNPFAVNMLNASNYCIPNNQYFAQYNASQVTSQVVKNNSNEDEYIRLLKELMVNIVNPLNNAVDNVQTNTTVRYNDPTFAAYFDRCMTELGVQVAQNGMFVKCNAELDKLLKGFMKNKTRMIWPPDEVPVVSNPLSPSTIEIARTPHSRMLIESLWNAMTPEELSNEFVRSTQCCMSGLSCEAIKIVCHYNLFATNKTAPIVMKRMRPYEMLCKNTWEGSNIYTTCYFCVSYAFWKCVEDAYERGISASIACTVPYVKEGFDENSFPETMLVNGKSMYAKNIAYLSGSILKKNFYANIYFDEKENGFRYIGDRFPKHWVQ